MFEILSTCRFSFIFMSRNQSFTLCCFLKARFLLILDGYLAIFNWFIFLYMQITLSYDTQQLSKATRNTAAIYVACRVDTSKVCCHLWSFMIFIWVISLYVWSAGCLEMISFDHAGFCLCAVTCSCSCRIDVATEFCHTNWLAKQNDSV